MDTSSTRQSLRQVQSVPARPDTPQIVEVDNLGSYLVGKRILDLVASILLLIAFCPFMLLIAVLVRLDSSGPVVYRQIRIGRRGNQFVLLKFRTMVTEAPTLPTDQMKRSNRSYYTRIGAVLRRYSIDELPQLWNVLIGDMSLIGPRPALPGQVWLNTKRQLDKVDQLWPGITGLAQVSGRDELPDAVKAAFDAEYRSRCSLPLDCQIVLRTLKAIVTGDGAN
jgi:O-antigen biosynthesis protein WbqP